MTGTSTLSLSTGQEPIIHSPISEINTLIDREFPNSSSFTDHSSGDRFTVKTRRKREREATCCVWDHDEEKSLILKRASLVEKMFSETGISRREEKELYYLNWLLDRIEDARYGENLDRLEQNVNDQKQLENDLRSFLTEVKAISIANPRKNKRNSHKHKKNRK
jgi:hypothetical protein